jgi:hypothetical protein
MHGHVNVKLFSVLNICAVETFLSSYKCLLPGVYRAQSPPPPPKNCPAVKVNRLFLMSSDRYQHCDGTSEVLPVQP